jgi:hypothetical protein
MNEGCSVEDLAATLMGGCSGTMTLNAVRLYDWDDFDAGYPYALGDSSIVDVYAYTYLFGGLFLALIQGYCVEVVAVNVDMSTGNCSPNPVACAQVDWYMYMNDADGSGTIEVPNGEFLISCVDAKANGAVITEFWPMCGHFAPIDRTDNSYCAPETSAISTANPCPCVPEVATILMMALGLLALGGFVYLRRRHASVA